MHIVNSAKSPVRLVSIGVVVLGLVVLAIISCNSTGPERRGRFRTAKNEVGVPKGVARWRQPNYGVVKVSLPSVADAEYINDDSFCATCHEVYVKKFESNVHRAQKCEGCHGPASKHVATRGQEPGMILSFKTLPPAERAELCLKCHEQPHGPGQQWRTSAHANKGVTCTDCHRGHYNVPPGTPATELGAISNPHSMGIDLVEAQFSGTATKARLADFLLDDSDRRPAEAAQGTRVSLAALSKPSGILDRPDLVRAQEPTTPISLRGTSNNLGAVAPQVCFRCHTEMKDLEAVAHPHQVGGKNKFNCTTCHDPHGNVRPETRKDTCLECHKGAPTMAWHSSIHEMNDVACTDCHNPHPRSKVPEFVAISHTQVAHPKRMPMSVEEPEACFKCHMDIYAKTSMPSHHPIKEGKMVCSACHDAHGQAHGNLKDAATVNMVCWKCHAEKQGPFAYEHPPVTENCAICHEPHGTVANNLLRQPANFLCLRCHSGHRTSPLGPNHAPLLGDVGTSPTLQRAFYTECTQCHKEIHGSDLPTPHIPHGFMR